MTQGRRLWWSFVAALAVIATRAFTWHVPLGVDESDYMLRASEWLHGMRLYADLQSNRPPLLYAVFAAVSRAGRAAAVDPGIALRVASALVMAVALALLVYVLLSRVRPLAVFAAAASFVAMSATLPIEGVDANAEHWIVLPWLTSVLLLLPVTESEERTGHAKWLPLASGVLLGCAVLIKQVAIAGILVPVVAALLDRSDARVRLGRLAWFFAGGLIAAAASLAWAAATGQLAEFIVFGSNVFYVGLPTLTAPAALAADRVVAYAPTVTLPAIVALAAVALLPSSTKAGNGRLGSTVAVSWLLAAVVAIALPGRYYAHYFVLAFAPVSLLVAIGVDRALVLTARTLRIVLLAVLSAVLAVQSIWAVLGYRSLDAYAKGRSAGPEVARVLQAAHDRGTRVFVWGGDSAPLVYAGMRPAYPVLWAYYPLNVFGDQSRQTILGVPLLNYSDRLLAEFQARPAEVVVLTRPLAGEGYVEGLDPVDDDTRFAEYLNGELARAYSLDATIHTAIGPMTVWSRR